MINVLQVFNKETRRYKTVTKYVGRQLNDDGFKNAIREFLYNGRRMRYDILEIVLYKLKDLRKILAKLESFRFFTSSLLVLYDSSESGYSKSHQRSSERDKDRDCTKTQEQNRAWADTRWEHDQKVQDSCRGKTWAETHRERGCSKMQDQSRAKVRCDAKRDHMKTSTEENRCNNSWDESLTDEVPSNCDQENRLVPEDISNHPVFLRDQCTIGGGKVQREQLSKSESEPPYKNKPRYKNKHRTKVDVRLIDFAHATHKGMGDPKVYSGPDDGIIFGVDSLIKIFKDIRDSCEK